MRTHVPPSSLDINCPQKFPLKVPGATELETAASCMPEIESKRRGWLSKPRKRSSEALCSHQRIELHMTRYPAEIDRVKAESLAESGNGKWRASGVAFENRDIRAMIEPTQLSQPSQAKREFYLRRKVQFAGVQGRRGRDGAICEQLHQFLGSREK